MVSRGEWITVRTHLASTCPLRSIHPVMALMPLRMHLMVLLVLLHLAALGVLLMGFLQHIRVTGSNHADTAALGPAFLFLLMSRTAHGLVPFLPGSVGSVRLIEILRDSPEYLPVSRTRFSKKSAPAGIHRNLVCVARIYSLPRSRHD